MNIVALIFFPVVNVYMYVFVMTSGILDHLVRKLFKKKSNFQFEFNSHLVN